MYSTKFIYIDKEKLFKYLYKYFFSRFLKKVCMLTVKLQKTFSTLQVSLVHRLNKCLYRVIAKTFYISYVYLANSSFGNDKKHQAFFKLL